MHRRLFLVSLLAAPMARAETFEVTLTEPPSAAAPQGQTRKFTVHGDEWRIDARVLKWKPWANVLGLDTQYRLDRLSGRYESTQPPETPLQLWAPRRWLE